MDGHIDVVERTEEHTVTEEIPVVTTHEPEPEPATEAVAEVVAAQGAVAVAAEAVALANETSAAAELQAAETVAEAERSFRTRVEEVLEWQGATVGALANLQQEQALMREALLSIQSRLTASETARSSSTETVELVNPDLDAVVEDNQEAVKEERRKRHRWI